MALQTTFLQDPQCPTYKTCGSGYGSFSLGKVPSYVGFVSDSLSCVASVAMVLIYLAWKDIRKKGAQSIVTFIAIADFFTASAYFAGSVNMVVHYNQTDSHRCEVFQVVCEIESCVVTWATMSSYLWTVILAFYFYLAIVRNKARLAMKMIPLYHVIAWGTPIPIMLPLLITNKLTYSPFVSAIWCYLDVNAYFFEPPFTRRDLSLVIAIKLPEVISYIVILVLYGITLRHIYRFRTETPRSDQAQAVSRVEKILVFIPVLFIILRVWGTVQYLYVIFVSGHTTQNGDCIPYNLKRIYITLGILQAVGGGGQGWANGILYIFLSPTIRNRLIRLLWCPRRSTSRVQVPSSTFFSPPISNYKTISTDSVRNVM